MDVRLVRLLAGQDDVVARWQLLGAGWTRHAVEQAVRARGWRRVHDGVYVASQAPLTQRQRWIAAVLTAPGTFLAGRSAAACHGIAEEGPVVEVVRVGNGGPRRYPGLLVRRSCTLKGQTGRRDGIPVVAAERALVDLAPVLGAAQLGRAFREACRLRCATPNSIARAVHGQRGTARLASWCDRYATIPYHRTRSDAEGRGLEILFDAGIPLPGVNVKLRGPRPDYTWRQHRLIIEIDGAQFHLFADEDARKQAIWEGAGYHVGRLPSDDVYFRPQRLIALYRSNVPSDRP